MDVNGQTCIIHKDIYIYINCFDLSDSDLVSRWGGPFKGHKWLSETPKCVHEMHWIVFCTCVCMYVYIHAITINYIHVFYMIVWYSMCICISYIYVPWWPWCIWCGVLLPAARSSAVGECEGTVPQASWTQVPWHPKKETDETFLCSDIGFNVWCL